MINQVTEESFKEIGQPASSATAGPPHTSLQSPELLGEIGFPSPSTSSYLLQVLYKAEACVCVCECGYVRAYVCRMTNSLMLMLTLSI